MEQVIDWLNENELRAYPLLDGADKTITPGVTVPDNFILDLQLVSYTEIFSGQTILLKKISYLEDLSLKLVFGSSSTDLTTFTIPQYTTKTYPLYMRNPDGNLIVLGKGVLELAQALGEPMEIITSIPTEPALFTEFTGAWLGVQSVTCSPEKKATTGHVPLLPLESVASPTALTGDIVFAPGYNFKVYILDNLIDLEIGEGYGLKMNCRTSFIPEEYLDCHQLVSSINGVFPDDSGNFSFNAGSNIVIAPGNSVDTFDDRFSEQSNAHTLFVGLTFSSTDFCAPVNITPTLL